MPAKAADAILAWLRKHKRSRRWLGAEIGVGDRIARMLYRTRPTSIDELKAIHRVTGIALSILLDADLGEDVRMRETRADLSDAAAAVVKISAMLQEAQRMMGAAEGTPVRESEDLVAIPGLGVNVGARTNGGGGKGGDDAVYMHPDEIGGRELYWAPVRGSCMAPRVEEGDTLVFERIADSEVKDRDYLVLLLLDEGADGSHVVKRVRWIGPTAAILEAKDGTETKVDMRRVRIIGRYVKHIGNGI